MKYEQCGEFVIWHKVNADPGFYEDLGPFFGSRQVERELGYKMYDDPDRVWLIAKAGQEIAGVSSYEAKEGKAHLRSTYVMPEYRQKGLYKAFCDIREREVEGATEISVTAKADSVMAANWQKRGYTEHSLRGRFIVFKKVIV